MTTVKKNHNDKYGRKKQLKLGKTNTTAIMENDNIKGSENNNFKPTINAIYKESNAMINRKETILISSSMNNNARPEFFPIGKQSKRSLTNIESSLTNISLNSTVQNNDLTLGLSELNETSIDNSSIPLDQSVIITDISFDHSIINNTINGNGTDTNQNSTNRDQNIAGSTSINGNNAFDNKNTFRGEPKKESIFNKIIGFFSTFISNIVSSFKSFVGFIMRPFTKQQDTHESTPERSAQQHDLNNNEEVNISQNIQHLQDELTNDVIIDNGAQQPQHIDPYIGERSPTMLNHTQTNHRSFDEINENDNNRLKDFSLEYNPYDSPYFKNN